MTTEFCCAAIELSEDHKPDLPRERARVEGLGGTATWGLAVTLMQPVSDYVLSLVTLQNSRYKTEAA